MPKRYYLIDGYNLIHAAGLSRASFGPGGLERARNELVAELAACLDREQCLRSTVVFDSKAVLAEADSQTSIHGIVVRYSGGYHEADDLIEEIIREHSAPRQLIVVSSDHRLQQAARRRNAHSIDSEKFWDSRHRLQNESGQVTILEQEEPFPKGLTLQDEALAEELQRELDQQSRRANRSS